MNVLATFGIIVLALSLCDATINCLGAAVGTVVPNEADCGSFYVCDGYGGGQLNNCFAGYLFDPVRKYCRPSTEVSCGSGSVTPAPTAAPTPGPTPTPTIIPTVKPTVTSTVKPTVAPPTGEFTGNECKSPGVVNGDLLPYPGDCARFIQCAYTVAVVKSCPSILHFNKSIRVCDWPDVAGCMFEVCTDV